MIKLNLKITFVEIFLMIALLNQNFDELNSYIEEITPSKILILVDENTHEFCLPILLANLATEIPFEIIEIDAGEEMKTIETATQLWEIFSDFEADRKSLLINLGGGVITDLGGFVASTYKRGIKFINVPTSLLGMCDAAIGGKTGIDHQFLKNIIGTFAEAEITFVYPDFLKTLPFEELRSGFAEMLKHGLIADENHWKDLTSLPEITPENISPFIATSMKLKENVVTKDFKEQHIRKTLNFGHTVGHAVESLFLENATPILHGEAVALGMICETYLSYLLQLISYETTDEIIQQLSRFFPLIRIDALDSEHLLRLMQNDKKNGEGHLKFALLNAIGNSVFDIEVSANQVKDALHFYQKLN